MIVVEILDISGARSEGICASMEFSPSSPKMCLLKRSGFGGGARQIGGMAVRDGTDGYIDGSCVVRLQGVRDVGYNWH